MAELRRILATIENKNIVEGTLGDAGEQFAKRLIGKSGKELVKELGPRVEIATVIKTPKKVKGKVQPNEFVEKEVKEVWELIPETEIYTIKSVDIGKGPVAPKTPRNKTADIIKTEVETAAKEGRTVRRISKGAGSEPAGPTFDPAAEATTKAEKLSIDELEKKIASKEGTALQQKAYADALAKKKASNPKPENPTAEIIPFPNKAKPPKAETPPKEEPSAPKTGEEVLVKKEIEQAKDTARQALDDGTVKIKDENLLTRKPNETPTEQLERTLADRYKGEWAGLEGTAKEVGFWRRIGRKAKVGGLISIPVLLAAGGAYLAMRDTGLPEPEEEVLDGETDAATDGETDAGKTDAGKTDAGKTDAGKTDAGKTDAGKTDAGKTDAEKNAEVNQAGKVTDKEEPSVANKPTPEQDKELAKLKSQIDALIAELAKSKDPAIQKRLAAVRAKLGQANQAASVTSTEKGGWKNIGNNYRRWYGPDGVDEEGTFVKRGTVDNIPYDAGQVDKYAKMTNAELLKHIRTADRSTKP